MLSRTAYAATLTAALALCAACGDDAEDPDPARSLAAGGVRASASPEEAAPNNRAPEIAAVSLIPSHPTSEGMLEAQVQATDPDGDMFHLSYVWKLNGSLLEEGKRGTLQLPRLERGDRIELFVTASDGKLTSSPMSAIARVDNRPPQITFLYFTPQNKRIRRGDVLTAVPDATDPENDRIEYTYRWRVNGQDASDERQFDTKSLRRGDKITVEVVANDGDAQSPPRTLDPIELVNSAPVIKQLPALEHQGNTLAYQFEAEDAEGDRNLRFFLGDAPDGMEIDSISGLLTWQPGAAQTGKHKVEVGVKDSEGDATKFEWEVSVSAAAPPAARAN
jgi:hypothetical protein